eukprot:RCo039605
MPLLPSPPVSTLRDSRCLLRVGLFGKAFEWRSVRSRSRLFLLLILSLIFLGKWAAADAALWVLLPVHPPTRCVLCAQRSVCVCFCLCFVCCCFFFFFPLFSSSW